MAVLYLRTVPHVRLYLGDVFLNPPWGVLPLPASGMPKSVASPMWASICFLHALKPNNVMNKVNNVRDTHATMKSEE